MAETTKIEWADATANFWMGCTKLSPACDWCYAERDWDKRRHHVTWGPHGERVPVKAGDLVIRKHQRHAAAFIAEHSRKPEDQYTMVEQLFEGPYAEVFSRANRAGWGSFGDEAGKFVGEAA